jgi:hypothetical protein
MHARQQRKRAGKRLLAAAIGVASVSYVGTQSGCAPDASDEELGTSAAAEDDSVTPDVAENALIKAPELELQRALPTSGNLVPPQNISQIAISRDAVIAVPIKVFPPSGNLMPPPGVLTPVVVTPVVVTPPLPPSGNLMAPPLLDQAVTTELETQ